MINQRLNELKKTLKSEYRRITAETIPAILLLLFVFVFGLIFLFYVVDVRQSGQQTTKKINNLTEQLKDAQATNSAERAKDKAEIKKLQDQLNNQDKKIESIKARKAEVKLLLQPLRPVTIQRSYGSRGAVADYITAKFGPYAAKALRVANCESGLNPTNLNKVDTNGHWSAGVFQVNGVHGQIPEYWFDYKTNIDYAYQLSKGGTVWKDWPNCGKL